MHIQSSIFGVCLLTMHFLQALLDACKTGNVGVVMELLKGGANPNQADEVRGILPTMPIIMSVGCENNYCLYRIVLLLFTGPVTRDMMR